MNEIAELKKQSDELNSKEVISPASVQIQNPPPILPLGKHRRKSGSYKIIEEF